MDADAILEWVALGICMQQGDVLANAKGFQDANLAAAVEGMKSGATEQLASVLRCLRVFPLKDETFTDAVMRQLATNQDYETTRKALREAYFSCQLAPKDKAKWVAEQTERMGKLFGEST
jgi:hypothetical protein